MHKGLCRWPLRRRLLTKTFHINVPCSVSHTTQQLEVLAIIRFFPGNRIAIQFPDSRNSRNNVAGALEVPAYDVVRDVQRRFVVCGLKVTDYSNARIAIAQCIAGGTAPNFKRCIIIKKLQISQMKR